MRAKIASDAQQTWRASGARRSRCWCAAKKLPRRVAPRLASQLARLCACQAKWHPRRHCQCLPLRHPSRPEAGGGGAISAIRPRAGRNPLASPHAHCGGPSVDCSQVARRGVQPKTKPLGKRPPPSSGRRGLGVISNAPRLRGVRPVAYVAAGERLTRFKGRREPDGAAATRSAACRSLCNRLHSRPSQRRGARSKWTDRWPCPLDMRAASPAGTHRRSEPGVAPVAPTGCRQRNQLGPKSLHFAHRSQSWPQLAPLDHLVPGESCRCACLAGWLASRRRPARASDLSQGIHGA